MKQTMEMRIKVCTENIRTAQYSEDAEECLRSLIALRDQELLEKIEGMNIKSVLELTGSDMLVQLNKHPLLRTLEGRICYNQCLTDVSEVIRKNI